jgi:hypothetical protein
MARTTNQNRPQRLQDIKAVRGMRRQRAIEAGTLFGFRSVQIPNRRREQSRTACRRWDPRKGE